MKLAASELKEQKVEIEKNEKKEFDGMRKSVDEDIAAIKNLIN